MGYIIKPIVTEKMSKLTDKSSLDKTRTKKGEKYTIPAQPKYGFIVKPEADKADIKKEVEALYGVKVLAVNTMCYAGKRMSRYTKQGLVKGQRNAFKKAIVTIQNGDAIDFYSNIK